MGIRDIILGMDIAPPSVQRQEMDKIEKDYTESGKGGITTVTTKTVNSHDEEMLVTTSTPYESQKFTSRTEWRVRALTASMLPMRISNLYVNQASSALANSGSKADAASSFTYVFPKNLLAQFICSSDLRTQVAVFLYGTSAPDAPQVKEVRAFVLPPQVGSHEQVTLPLRIPDEILAEGPREKNVLSGLEPLGWLCTQPKADAQQDGK